jgi:hypothetical protein
MKPRLDCMGAVLWLALAAAVPLPLLSAPNVLVPAGSVWKYLPITNDVGTAWRDFDFDDSGWASGLAQLGYGDEDEATVVPFVFDQNGGKNISTYFRHAFRATNTAQVTNLLVRLLRDDGAVVYLNGVELFRNNMPAGTVVHATPALFSIAAPEENTVFFPTNVPPTALREGTNVLAVEIHQYSPASQDISFDLELVVEASPPSRPPVIAITAPVIGEAFHAGAEVPLAVTTSDPDGTVASVEYFAGGVRLGEVHQPPFSLRWSNAPAGPHALTARATDDSGAWTTSAPRVVRVGGFMLVSTGAVWKYLDDQTDPGTAWRERGFDDSGWSNGAAPLGFGDEDEATPIRWKIDGVPIITAYFRRQFVAPDPGLFSQVMLRLLRDDGGIVYLNGVEIFRSNMPGGPVDYRTYALQAVPTGPEESVIYFPTNVAKNLLRRGTNMLAVEIHQITQFSSTDLSFDCELAAFLTDDAARLSVIRLGSLLQLSWPMWTERLTLQTTTSLTPPVPWTAADTNLVKDLNGFRYVELPDESTGQRFFRLQAE